MCVYSYELDYMLTQECLYKTILIHVCIIMLLYELVLIFCLHVYSHVSLCDFNGRVYIPCIIHSPYSQFYGGTPISRKGYLFKGPFPQDGGISVSMKVCSHTELCVVNNK